jgi:hypothetical protein
LNLNPFGRIRQHWKRLGVVIFAPILLSLVLLQTSAFQQFLLRRISNFATAAGIEFSARRLDLNLWDLQERASPPIA